MPLAVRDMQPSSPAALATGKGQCQTATLFAATVTGASRSRETSMPCAVHALQQPFPAALVGGSAVR